MCQPFQFAINYNLKTIRVKRAQNMDARKQVEVSIKYNQLNIKNFNVLLT